jgi:hypothetical protein
MKTSLNTTTLTGWKVDPRFPNHVIFDSYIDNILGCSASIGVTCQTPEQARLVAAAPKLLAALRECITEPGAACLNGLTRHAEGLLLRRRIEAINELVTTAITQATTP